MTNYERILQFVEEASVDELRSLTRHQFAAISGFLTPTQFQNFMFAKNIKIFGGINGYVNDIFDKNTVERILAMPAADAADAITGLVRSFERMLSYDDLTEGNRQRIQQALVRISGTSAPAAGGSYRRKYTYSM